jgi:DNA-binding CsgD family transcriptional regulator
MNNRNLKNIKENLQSLNINSSGYLTPREEEILLLRIKGLSKKNINDILKIRYKTLNDHLSNIRDKFDVAEESSAIAACFLCGYIRR